MVLAPDDLDDDDVARGYDEGGHNEDDDGDGRDVYL